MADTIYLVTGAMRGIGNGIVRALLLRHSVTVIAAVRDPSHPTSLALSKLPTGPESTLIAVKIDASLSDSALAAVKELQTSHSITHIDVVIAVAGISKFYGPAAETPISEMRDHFEVNTIAILALFQATWPLLQKSAKPVFVAVSTASASIGDMARMPLPTTAYGASKAAMNYVLRKIHYEHEKLIVFPVHPGWVQTEMGNHGARVNGLDAAPVTIKESVDGILGKVDGATRESTSGTFQAFDGSSWAW